MSTQIEIICYSIDKENIHILSVDPNNHILPHMALDRKNINTNNLDINFYLTNILKQYTNIDINWADPKLIDIKIYEEDNEIKTSIYYACYIPYHSLINGKWIPLSKDIAHNKIIQKILCLI